MSDELQAGRALDALVAEKVMGRVVTSEWDFVTIPDYSTSIAAAWEVVERMQNDWDWDVVISATTDGYSVLLLPLYGMDAVRVRMDKRKGGMPLAICRAALKAVGA